MERSVLVTGAGSGIGLASAIEAARLGFTSVAAVHRAGQVEPARAAAAEAGVTLEVEVLDVVDEGRATEVIDRVEPWALVNNAGYMNAGLVEDVPITEARRQFDVMVFGPMRLAQAALPGMRRRGGGRIVNISSTVGEMSVPFQGWYDAAERALKSLSDALRVEVAGDGIDVVVVEPGATATPLWLKARAELIGRGEATREPSRYDRAVALVDEVAQHGGDPGEVARVVGGVLHAGHPRYRYRVGPGWRIVAFGPRLLPTSVRDRVTRAVGGL